MKKWNGYWICWYARVFSHTEQPCLYTILLTPLSALLTFMLFTIFTAGRKGSFAYPDTEVGDLTKNLLHTKNTSKMLHIAHIITHAEIGDSPMGGAQVHLLLLLQNIDRKNFHCRVITGGGEEFVNRINALGWETIIVPELVRSIHPVKDYVAIKKIVRILREQHPDLIHTHTSKGGVIGRIAARQAKIRRIVHTVHGFGFHDLSNPIRKHLVIYIERFLGRFTDKLICVSQEIFQSALAYRFVPPDKAICIPNSIDLSRFDPDKLTGDLFDKFNLTKDATVIGMVGRLDAHKDPITFVNAATYILKEFPDIKFILIGDGPLRATLEQTVRSLQIHNSIIFAGWSQDVPSLLNDIKIFVLTSLREGLPLTIIEAMAMAKPVVATDIIGNREVVVNGETGFLVPPKDPEGLASAVMRLLRNPELMAEMGRAGRKRAVENYDVKLMVKNTEAVYRQIISENEKTLTTDEHR